MLPAIRLIQADDLDAWQRVLLALCLPAAPRGEAARARLPETPLMIVPSRGAAEQWRRTIERRVLVERWSPPRALQDALAHPAMTGAVDALMMPRLVTRDELHDVWHRESRLEMPRVPSLTREVLMGASAREAARTHRPPFLLRPGLIAEMLRLYDQVTRLGQDPLVWLEHAASTLADEAAVDRGAERLLVQTRFLQDAFGGYVRRVAGVEGLDEAALRAALSQLTTSWSPRHVIVSVGDHHSHGEGLWPVDLDMLSRARGLERVDVVATRRMGEALFSRLRRAWPSALDIHVPPQRPSETRLEVASTERRWIACRDREEEVLSYARRVKRLAMEDASSSALVYRRPLPYLYAAQHLLSSAGVPFQTSGTLPLAAEPWAASLDLLMDAALSGFTRTSLVTLLRSPHVRVCRPDGTDVSSADVQAFDAWLASQRYLGGLDHLDALLATRPPDPPSGGSAGSRRAMESWQQDLAARAVASGLRPLLARLAPLQALRAGADHVAAVRDAWRSCERVPQDEDPQASRTRRTRAALELLLDQLQRALAAHDPTPVPPRDTCVLLRRWIEERTFALPRSDEGVHLVDADAAAYGVFAHARLVGLLEGEWPEPTARDIFYPAFMLERLGWADERTRTATLRARLADLLTLPSSDVGVSVPELDQDAVVRPSSLLDELQAVGADRLVPIPDDERTDPVTREDALLATPAHPRAPLIAAGAQEWAAWRLARPARPPAGHTGPVPAERYSVTAVETYLQCPFQYFAGRVLRLREEPEDEPGLPARDAGTFLHDVLHDCYQDWHRLGRTVIGPGDLPEARAVFEARAGRALLQLPPADRALERVRLFGSAVAAGAIEKVLRVEAEMFGDVSQRLLEHDIDLAVVLPAEDGTRTVRLLGRADRVDVTVDGRVRIVDYKIGRKPAFALQPAVYAHAVVQEARAAGRALGIAPSGFIALREDAPWVAAITNEAAAETQARAFVGAVEAIEAGVFPVRPKSEFRCQFCDYAGVCRKEFAGDE
jgi:RecB family exonuclease